MEFEIGRGIRSLPVRLTDEELLKKGDELAKLQAKVGELELEKKASAEDYKARITRCQNDSASIAQHIRDRREFRDVEVVSELDAERREVNCVRTDTGEVIATRPAHGHELQAKIPFAPEN